MQFALPFLHHSSVALRLAAIRLIAKVAGDGRNDELLMGRQDDSKKVTLAAKRGLQARGAELSPERLCEIAENDPRQHVQLAAAEVLNNTGSWRGLPFLLRLCVHPNDQLADRAMTFIRDKFNRVFTAPNLEERHLIQAAISEFGGRLPQSFSGEFNGWLTGRT